jgi:predicted phosphodiesterase
MNWQDRDREALIGLYENYGADIEMVVYEAAELLDVDPEEVREELRTLLEGGYISPEVADPLGLASRMPMKLRKLYAEYVAYIETALKSYKPFEVPASFPDESKKESLVICLSDWHVGKLIKHDRNSYNTDMAQLRVAEMYKSITRLIEKFIHVPFKEIVVLITGDMVDGSDIYPGQASNQDATMIPQVNLLADMIWRLLRSLRDRYELPVRCHAVKGNHGVANKRAPSDANWDLMAYQKLYGMTQVLSEERGLDAGIQFVHTMNDSHRLIVNGKKITIIHEMPTNPETPANSSKFSGQYDIQPYDIIVYGHYHHTAQMWHQGRALFMNGSICGPDDLSNRMGKWSPPAQIIFGVPADARKKFSFYYPIYIHEGILNDNEANVDERLTGPTFTAG